MLRVCVNLQPAKLFILPEKSLPSPSEILAHKRKETKKYGTFLANAKELSPKEFLERDPKLKAHFFQELNWGGDIFRKNFDVDQSAADFVNCYGYWRRFGQEKAEERARLSKLALENGEKPEKIYFSDCSANGSYVELDRSVQSETPAWVGREHAATKDHYQKTAVKIKIKKSGVMQYAPIKANAISFTRKSTNISHTGFSPKPNHIAVAGQAPRCLESCNRLLVHGLDSRHGLFQFVGARDAIHHNKRDDWSVIDDVLDRLERQHGADADRLIIAGRYAITAMERMPTIESGHRCYKLTAHDVKSPNSGKTMLITEADLNYRTDILRFREIERANAMMEAHTRESRRSGPGNSAQDPAVLDHFGWGSNAALICYREAIRRLGDIDKVEQIDDLIKEIVADETRVRGQFFLGPREQIAELKIAIIRRFHELNQDTSGEDSAAASNDKVGQVRVRPDEKSVKPKKRVRFADEVLRHTETGTNAL